MFQPIPCPETRRRLDATLSGFVRDESGATAAEYAFLLILVVGSVATALVAVGTNTSGLINASATKI